MFSPHATATLLTTVLHNSLRTISSAPFLSLLGTSVLIMVIFIGRISDFKSRQPIAECWSEWRRPHSTSTRSFHGVRRTAENVRIVHENSNPQPNSVLTALCGHHQITGRSPGAEQQRVLIPVLRSFMQQSFVLMINCWELAIFL